MRTLSITLVALALVSCSFGKKRKSKTAIIKAEKTTTTSKPDPCQALIKMVTENRKFIPYTSHDGTVFKNAPAQASYWPWGIDSTVQLANSNCWIGVDKKVVDSIFQKPYRIWNGNGDSNCMYFYKIAKSYKDAASKSNLEVWSFLFDNNKVKSSELTLRPYSDPNMPNLGNDDR